MRTETSNNIPRMTLEQVQEIITNHKNINIKFANDLISWYFSNNLMDWEAFLETKRVEKIRAKETVACDK